MNAVIPTASVNSMFARTSSANVNPAVGEIPRRLSAITVPLSIIPSPAGVAGKNMSVVSRGWSRKNSR